METFVSVLAWVIVISFIVLSMVFTTRMVGNAKSRSMKLYMQQHFPELPTDVVVFPAKQTSRANKLNIALIINEEKEEILILLENRGTKLENVVYQYSDLVSAVPTDQIISRGAILKSYYYERNLELRFIDGQIFQFIANYPTNKNGDEKVSKIIKDDFAPWEKKLKAIQKKNK